MAAVKGELVDRRDGYASARAGKAQLLANTRASRHELEDARRRARSASRRRCSPGCAAASGVAGPIRQGSGS